MFLKRAAHAGARFSVALSLLSAGPSWHAQVPASAGTTPFVFDGNRMYAELGFVRPDGSIHRALAFVDMGSSSMTLTESLFKELQLDHNERNGRRLTIVARVTAF